MSEKVEHRIIKVYLNTVREKKLIVVNRQRQEYALLISKEHLKKLRERGLDPENDRVLVYYVEIDGKPGILMLTQ